MAPLPWRLLQYTLGGVMLVEAWHGRRIGVGEQISGGGFTRARQ
jgi:hypothetical protein